MTDDHEKNLICIAVASGIQFGLITLKALGIGPESWAVTLTPLLTGLACVVGYVIGEAIRK